jgi:hypothetical protein
MEDIGNVITLPEKTGNELIRKGLVYPYQRRTKEDKEAFRVSRKITLKHDVGPMFFVMEGDKIIDRLTKKKAQELADDLNK